ncbi:uncharacterized protein ACBT57_021945 [Dama dama]
MLKRRAGSRKGWYARQRSSLVERMRQLTIQETVLLPTAQQIQALLQMAYAEYFGYDYDHDHRNWIVDIPSITKSTGYARRVNGTGPKDIPFCGLGVKGRYIAVPWKLCRDETATVYSITNDTHSLWDWSPDSNRNPRKEGGRQLAARIWNLGGTTVYQTEIWKLLAAFKTDGSLLRTGGKTKGVLSWRACGASQKRMNTSVVPAVLASSFTLPAPTLPSADGVSSKTAGTVNRVTGSSSTKAQIPSALLLQHPAGCCPPKHGGNWLTSNISAFQPLLWG